MLRQVAYWVGYYGATVVINLCKAMSPDFNTWCAVQNERLKIKLTFIKGGVEVK